MTFKMASRLYLKNYVYTNCSPSTIKSYEGYLKHHIYPKFGDKALCKITKLDIDSFKAELLVTNSFSVVRKKDKITKKMLNRTLSNQTINHIINCMSAIFEYMIDSEVIMVNPTARVKRLKIIKNEPNYLDKTECLKLLKVVKEHEPYYYPLILTSIVTGMRQGETFALTWSDVDLKNGRIHLNKSYSKNILGDTKTEASRRTVNIPDVLIKCLREHKIRVQNNPKNLVFPNKEGNYINPSNIRKRVLDKCLKIANLKQVTWHQLRHSCITVLTEYGVPLKCIQKQVGHNNPQTTLNIYSHVTNAMEQQAVIALEKAFG